MALYAPSIMQNTQDTPPMARDANWITTGDAARILQVDSITVRRWYLAGRLKEMGIKTYTPGKHAYLWRPDVEDYARRAISDPHTDADK